MFRVRVNILGCRVQNILKQEKNTFRSGNHKWGNVRGSTKRTNLAGKEVGHVLNRILWDGNKQQQQKTYKTIIKSIITCSCEIWQIKDATKRLLEAVEMYFWRRVAGKSSLESNKWASQGNCASNAYCSGWNKEQTVHMNLCKEYLKFEFQKKS